MQGQRRQDFKVKEIIQILSEALNIDSNLKKDLDIEYALPFILEGVQMLVAENKILKNDNIENEIRVNNIVDTLVQYTRNGIAQEAPVSNKHDEVDAIAIGLNILVEELETSNKSEKKYITNLEQSEERYKMLVEGIKDHAIYMLDCNGNIISWNKGAEHIKGYSSDEIIGKHFSIFYTQEEIEINKPLLNLEFCIKNGSFEGNAWRVKKNGTVFWANFIITSLYDNQGKLYGFSKIIRDVTDKKKAEEKISQLNRNLENNILQLEEVNKELESFSYSVSHDLRAPLRAIHGYTNILFEDFFQNAEPEANRLMSLITYNAERMGRLVDDLLAFSQLGRKMISIREINFYNLVQSIITDFRNATPDLNIDLKIMHLHNADGDYSLITQVFFNLISNAIKYSSLNPNPIIEIGSIKETDNVIYYVKDNGVGFDMKYYHKLFGIFQRLHKAREFEGTGVGLALVQRIIFKHGGAVWAEAEVGVGATFYFSLNKKS